MQELRVIAKRVDGAYLIAINDTDGFMISEEGKVISPIMMYDAILKFGYWDEIVYDPDLDLKKIYAKALRLSKSAEE